jgi:RHS repeat-associated protein
LAAPRRQGEGTPARANILIVGRDGERFPSALRFDAFGQRSALAGPNYPTSLQYAGGWGYQSEFSDTSDPALGLDYLEQRYYEPATGRFISPDPIGFAGGLNLFAYCDNDPVNVVDPEGLYGIWVGGVHLGDDHPWLVFDAPGVRTGLGTGLAAVGSAGSFGLWDGGDAQCQPGFGTSRALAAFGRDILLWEAGGALLGRAAPLLSRIPRPALRLRPGFLRLPGSAAEGARLRTHLRLLQKYGRAGFRELENGRFRYYGELRPASKTGEMAGLRVVREWDPITGRIRTWLETLDHTGRVRIVRPETGGPKVHYMFDAGGRFIGKF